MERNGHRLWNWIEQSRPEGFPPQLGLSQPDVSRRPRGHFRDFSLERLLRLLMALDRDVEIVIRRKPRSRARSRLRVSAA